MLQTVITWILFAVLCSLIIKVMLVLDYNKKIYNHAPGPCKYVDGIIRGAVDIELLADGLAIISTGYKPSDANETRNFKGRLYMFQFTPQELNRPPKAVEIKLQGEEFDPKTFNPGGLSSYVSKGRVNLYVVNTNLHGPDSIECFLFDKAKKTAVHMKTIKHELIYSVNDLFAVGPDKFYLTNDHYFKSRFMRKMELYMILNMGNIIYYDGKTAFIKESWITNPRGLTMDKTQKHLYVSFGTQETIRVYNATQDTVLTKHVDMSVLTTPNKIFADLETGDLWTATYPILHESIDFMDHPKTGKCSSQVLHVKIQGAQDRWVLTEPFASDGSVISASSSVAFYKGQLLIGSLTQKLLLCEIGNPEVN